MTDLGGVRDWLAAADFPADTDALLALLIQRRAPAPLVELVHELPWSVTFGSLADLLAYPTRL